MASARYTRNIKPEDLQPDAPQAPMTPQQKRENFWFYHKWHIIIGAAAALIIGYLVYTTVTNVRPDYNIAILTTSAFPETALDNARAELEQYAQDRNGDGKVYIELQAYEVSSATLNAMASSSADSAADDSTMTAMADPYTQMAGSTKLMSDYSTGTSMIFIVDNIEARFADSEVFLQNDGTFSLTPNFDDMGYLWKNCPVLANADLGSIDYDTTSVPVQSYYGDYRLVMRNLEGTPADNEKNRAYWDDCKVLFDKITEGAQ